MFWYFPLIVLTKSWCDWQHRNIHRYSNSIQCFCVWCTDMKWLWKMCSVSFRHLHHILLHKYDSDSHLLLCAFWCKHQVHFKRLWSPLVVHVDQTIIVSVVIHHDIPHHATAILFNLGPNSTKYSDVAW